MALHIDWIPSARASCFHAVDAVLRGPPCADATLAAALAEPADRLAEIAAECGLAAELLLSELIPLSVGCDDNRRLVKMAAARTLTELSTAALDTLDGAVAAVYQPFEQANTRVADQLQLRGPVLREQWEAYGPGLLRAIARSAVIGSAEARASVVLVHPFLGGGGQAFRADGLVTFEAVLANPVPELPEVVRLAWLLSQLELGGSRDPAAMVRHAVAAAEELGLARSSDTTLELARSAWHVA